MPIFYVVESKSSLTNNIATPEIAFNDYAAITGEDYSTLFIANTKPAKVKDAMKGFLSGGDLTKKAPPTGAYTVDLTMVKKGTTWQSFRNRLTYVPFTHKASSMLHWLKCYPGKNATKSANRLDAGCSPSNIFWEPTLALDELKKWHRRASCDEYPFASSHEGGQDSLIRGVPEQENFDQGHNLGAFLQRNIVTLAHNGGLFRVCVILTNGMEAGSC